MAKVEEKVGKELDDIGVLSNTVAMLAHAVQTQNDVLLILLHNLDLKIPDWKEKADIEKEIGPKIQACIEAVRKVYGRGETNKG